MIRRDLFEDIVDGLDSCQYISDLRSMIKRNEFVEIRNALCNLLVDDYTIQQWQELYQYLFKDNNDFKTNQQVYQALLDKLK